MHRWLKQFRVKEAVFRKRNKVAPVGEDPVLSTEDAVDACFGDATDAARDT